MIKSPKIKFIVDIEKDANTFFAFWKERLISNGQYFKWAVTNHYPQFKKYESKNSKPTKNEVSRLVSEIYKKKIKISQKAMINSNKNWRNVETAFFNLTKSLFFSLKWPKGRYEAYPTIWRMYPRFLEDKTFQIPINKNSAETNAIIAHEMLHFIYYEYLKRHFPKVKNLYHNMHFWHVSEMFNAFILNTKRWLKVFPSGSKPYPEHRKIINTLIKKYPEGLRVDLLTQIFIKEAKKLK